MPITVCQCPISTTLASIVTDINDCKVEVGQIQKAIFWRHAQHLDAAASAISSAVWTAHLTATGDSKAVVTPFISLSIPATEVREVGSGNEVRDGVPIMMGTLSAKVEGHIWQTDQATIRAMKALSCEDLDVMFVNENNQLVYSLEGGLVKGFRVNSMFVSDMSAGSYTDGTKNMFHFYLPGGWSDYATLSAATTFLLDMVNA
jgi:hypothetical protein